MSSFVEEIAPIVKRLAPSYDIRCPSAVIAQAILESGWGKSTLAAKYHNYFGIKCGTAWTGASVKLATKEEFTPGTVTDIRDNFRVYSSMEDGVRGYFELLQLSRYSNLKGITDPRTYLQTIKNDGYCTSSTYVDECMRIIQQNNLTQYDGGETMAGNLSEFVRLMRYWCDEGNLGYDQSNRWDIRVGGECDCSSLVIQCLKDAGFDVGSATYTGNMSSNLTARGWKRISNNGSPQVGDILLNDANHVAVCTAPGMLSQASIDERGKISGGQAGDQTDRETNTKAYYNYPWDCFLRYEGGTATTVPSKPSSGGDEKVYMFGYVSKGKTGTAVRMFQCAANIRFGYNLTIDGICGNNTDAAIRGIQDRLGLEVDGSCGPITWTGMLRA